MAKKKKEMQDATLINIRALKKRVKELEKENKNLKYIFKLLSRAIDKRL